MTPGQSIRWSARSTSLTFLERVLTRRRSSLKSTLDVHGKLGLNLLSCPSDPLLDLVFVHGLGGGSIKTWCHSKDATRFWPKEWLPRESGFHNVRIHSYGYDADWTSTKASPTINVHDFGQQLLERLRNSPEISNSRPVCTAWESMDGSPKNREVDLFLRNQLYSLPTASVVWL